MEEKKAKKSVRKVLKVQKKDKCQRFQNSFKKQTKHIPKRCQKCFPPPKKMLIIYKKKCPKVPRRGDFIVLVLLSAHISVSCVRIFVIPPPNLLNGTQGPYTKIQIFFIKPTHLLGLSLNLTPFTTGRGVNSNRAKNATFWGNALYAVFA